MGDMVTNRACTHAGIAMPPGMDPVDYVLLDFSPTEKTAIEEAIAKAGEAVPFMLKEGLAAAMNKYNQREAP
jgi:peptidyl-tRNA hydrolase